LPHSAALLQQLTLKQKEKHVALYRLMNERYLFSPFELRPAPCCFFRILFGR